MYCQHLVPSQKDRSCYRVSPSHLLQRRRMTFLFLRCLRRARGIRFRRGAVLVARCSFNAGRIIGGRARLLSCINSWNSIRRIVRSHNRRGYKKCGGCSGCNSFAHGVSTLCTCSIAVPSSTENPIRKRPFPITFDARQRHATKTSDASRF